MRRDRSLEASLTLQGALLFDPLPEARAVAAQSLRSPQLRFGRPALRLAARRDPDEEVQREAALTLLLSTPSYRSSRKLRKAGIVMSCVGGGVGLVALAIGLAGNANHDSNNIAWNDSGNIAPGLVVAGGVLSVVFLAAGITMAMLGSGSMDRIQKSELAFDLNLPTDAER